MTNEELVELIQGGKREYEIELFKKRSTMKSIKEC